MRFEIGRIDWKYMLGMELTDAGQESLQFTDRRALDDYLAPFIQEGVMPIGAIKGYKRRVIRQRQLPNDYLRR